MRRIRAAVCLTAMGGAAVWLGGCAGGGREDVATARPAALDAEREAQAQRIAQEAARLSGQREGMGVMPGSRGQAPAVMWMDQTIGRDGRGTAWPADGGAAAVSAAVPNEADVEEKDPIWGDPIDPTARASATPVSNAATADRGAMIDRLVSEAGAGQGGRLGGALRAAAVLAIESDRALPERVVQGLSEDEQRRVRDFHGVVRELLAATSRGEAIDPGALAGMLAEKAEPAAAEVASIRIGEMKLCTSVSGFGVYEPFKKDVFLAGRANKMIVYLELDGYTSELGAKGQHVVRLTQELELYDDAGLVVWRQQPESLRDEARRERRDFFTCQMVELPARLTVGKFYLKARVIDEATGHRAERSIPLEVVADFGLAVQGGRNVPLGG